jgi:hypothetical protein
MGMLTQLADLGLTSLVFTYPNLDIYDSEKVLEFYGQPNELGGIQSLNDTATGKRNEPFNLEAFTLKLQGLHDGKLSTPSSMVF